MYIYASNTHLIIYIRVTRPVAKFIVSELGDKVDSGIGLSYRSASLCNLAAGRVRQPYARVDFIPPSQRL
jgi:hypothetical protein